MRNQAPPWGFKGPWPFLIKLYDLAGIQDEFVVEGELDRLIKTDHPVSDKFLKVFDPSVSGSVFAGHLTAEALGEGVELLKGTLGGAVPLFVGLVLAAKELGWKAEHGIEETGPHAQLMAKGGLYASLYRMYTENVSGQANG